MAEPPKPTNLEEAHAALLRLLSPEQIEGLRSGPSATGLYHHGLGRFVRNQWIRQGRLSRIFSGLGHISVDAMSDIILQSFVSHPRGQLFNLAARTAKVSIAEQAYYASMRKLEAASPIDSAQIKWVNVRGHGQGAVHTSVSSFDGTCWRWVHGGSGQVEPASADKAARLKSRSIESRRPACTKHTIRHRSLLIQSATLSCSSCGFMALPQPVT